MKDLRLLIVFALLVLAVCSASAQTHYVTVLGEVNHPGSYAIMDDGNATVLDALAMAGDMTVYGMRNKVAVVRPNDQGEFSKTVINLDKKNIEESPVYRLQPGDRIYVNPNGAKTKTTRFGHKSTIWVSMLSTSVSVLRMVLTKLK